MRVRLTEGLQTGDVVEVEDEVGQAWLVSGKAELVVDEVETTEVAEAPETPEDPKKSATAGRKRTAADKPETR